MAKQQTFIAFFEDKEGKMINFERFCCKRVSTVQKYVAQLWNSPLYHNSDLDAAETVKIHATPNGIDKEPLPAAIIELAH